MNGKIAQCTIKTLNSQNWALGPEFEYFFKLKRHNQAKLSKSQKQRNVDGKFLNTIKSMFLKSSSRVKWNGKISPKLFNEFLQDLGKYLTPKYGLKETYTLRTSYLPTT